jgi:DNA-nicking Smr family endonuclease
MPRRLAPDEKALWTRVIATVQPLQKTQGVVEPKTMAKPPAPPKRAPPAAANPVSRPVIAKATASRPDNLDGRWDRRIDKGAVIPDISVDLHGSGLSGAYARLDGALEQAIAQKLKVVLLVTGKARTHDRASGQGRGAIASVIRDWLSASRHSASIAAVRTAHPRHGGSGALYIVLKS